MDPVSIGATIGLVTQGLSALDKTTDIAGRLKSLISRDNPDTAEMERLVSELHVELAQANLKQARLMTALAKMETDARKEDQFSKTRELYQVEQLPAGGQILRLRRFDPTRTHPIRVCQPCEQNFGKFIALQKSRTQLFCTNCGGIFQHTEDCDFELPEERNPTTGY